MLVNPRGFDLSLQTMVFMPSTISRLRVSLCIRRMLFQLMAARTCPGMLALPCLLSSSVNLVRLFTRLGVPFSQAGRSLNWILNSLTASMICCFSAPVNTCCRMSLRKSCTTLGVSDRLRSNPIALTLPSLPSTSNRLPSSS